jgi:hypothetical protein
MYAHEKFLSSIKLAIKETQAMTVYNMLQDMRHIIIVDFRPDVPNVQISRIRYSIVCNLDNYRKTVQ